MKVIMLAMTLAMTLLCHNVAAQTPRSMEMFTCNLAEGKTMADVMAVAADWDVWADDNFSKGYTAYVMQPVLFTGADFPMDFIWLGVSDSPSDLGAVMDEFMSKGQDYAKRFDDASPCNSHSTWGSMALRPMAGLPKPVFLQVRACQMKPGVSWGQVRSTQIKIAQWMDDNNIPGGNYLWWPGTGFAIDSNVDYYNVWVTNSLAERGAGLEAFRENNWGEDSYQIAGEDSLASCDNWRVWHAQPVGGK